MKLVPRAEVQDFRDPEVRARQAQYPPYRPQQNAWHGIKKVFGFFSAAAFIGLTVWNVYTLGGWLSDLYARKREERARRQQGYYWKRGVPRELVVEE
jgi:hypothetical protein